MGKVLAWIGVGISNSSSNFDPLPFVDPQLVPDPKPVLISSLSSSLNSSSFNSSFGFGKGF